MEDFSPDDTHSLLLMRHVEKETVIAEGGSCVESTQDFWLEAVELL